MENNYNLIMEKLKNSDACNARVEKKLDDYVSEDRVWKKELFEHLERNYAGKWTERLTLVILGGIIVGLVIAFINSIKFL